MPQTFEWNKLDATPIEKAQIDFLLKGLHPTPATLETLLMDQHDSGGFAGFWTAGQPAIDPSCYRLSQLAILDLLDHPQARAAADFLQRNWTHFPEACELQGHLPPWLSAGDNTLLYLKANSACHLALQKREVPQALLKDLCDANLNLGYWQTFWLTAALFHLQGEHQRFEQLSAHLQQHFPVLEREDLMWLCEAFLIAGVSVNHPVIQSAMQRILEIQEAAVPSAARAGVLQLLVQRNAKGQGETGNNRDLSEI